MAAPHNDSQLIALKTVEALEREHTVRLDDLEPQDRDDPERREALLKPFGSMNDEWERFKAELQPGDEIWTFSSSEESWAHLAGRAGLVIYRGDTPVRQLLTEMN